MKNLSMLCAAAVATLGAVCAVTASAAAATNMCVNPKVHFRFYPNPNGPFPPFLIDPNCTMWAGPIPQNQSLNILDYASQLVSQRETLFPGGGSDYDCYVRSSDLAEGAGQSVRALYYYDRDSNFLGIPDGPGHCYTWLYDTAASRSGLFGAALVSALVSQTPPDARALLSHVPGVRDAERKISGIHLQHFGFHLFESSDVCLKKVEAWRVSQGAAWAVWSHQANNCFGILSAESFAR